MTLLDLSIEEDIPPHPSCFAGCLRGAAFFSGLSEAELTPFQNVAQARAYKKGKVLYIEDEVADHFYVICGGWVKLFHTLIEGEEVVVDMLTVGHTVGESAIFESGRHTSSAQVVEAVQLLSIPAATLKEQISQSPTLALSMLGAMSLHHRRHYGEIALNAMQSAPQRIGCFLLRLCPADKKTNISFHLPYDKTLIAYTLGMKGATFSRALNILRKKTGLRILGTKIELDSVEPLIRYVYGSLGNANMQ